MYLWKTFVGGAQLKLQQITLHLHVVCSARAERAELVGGSGVSVPMRYIYTILNALHIFVGAQLKLQQITLHLHFVCSAGAERAELVCSSGVSGPIR